MPPVEIFAIPAAAPLSYWSTMITFVQLGQHRNELTSAYMLSLQKSVRSHLCNRNTRYGRPYSTQGEFLQTIILIMDYSC